MLDYDLEHSFLHRDAEPPQGGVRRAARRFDPVEVRYHRGVDVEELIEKLVEAADAASSSRAWSVMA